MSRRVLGVCVGEVGEPVLPSGPTLVSHCSQSPGLVHAIGRDSNDRNSHLVTPVHGA